MIVGNYTSYTKSDCYETVYVTSGVGWTAKGIDFFDPTTINVTIPLYRFPSSSTPTYSPDW